MVNVWFTERDLRERLREVKSVFWDELEDHVNLAAKRFLELGLRVERSLMIGAGRYKRTERRCDYANGYYSRDVICKLGVLSGVLMPRSRRGVYRSEILERYNIRRGKYKRSLLRHKLKDLRGNFIPDITDRVSAKQKVIRDREFTKAIKEGAAEVIHRDTIKEDGTTYRELAIKVGGDA